MTHTRSDGEPSREAGGQGEGGGGCRVSGGRTPADVEELASDERGGGQLCKKSALAALKHRRSQGPGRPPKKDNAEGKVEIVQLYVGFVFHNLKIEQRYDKF